MSVPFKDADELIELGTAGFLKIECTEEGKGFLGAFFIVNAKGEPVEFTYNRIDTPNIFLWRKDDIRRHASKKLATSLFALCKDTPRLILCLAQEIDSEVFSQDLQLSIPVCRLAPAIEAVEFSDAEVRDSVEAHDMQNAFWSPDKPNEESIEHRLFAALVSRGLLLEPFSRASIGLREVFAKQPTNAG
ncbi:MAG: hypothetical protein C4520_15710 [Candidatus Abyssobacteria bacterium SURF_5]|uniref:Uncharacterized protein n=1 Tax=Abyssobacteria bacterium (strain SURF_5) TaxID=2093360 RepID=A0A3A4NKN2_ABYX5|nr:MAG: hypothetical protein C4520_15710 [Candidatus Abyssubacteria bacterium SURF_5]